jgi:hypothetical protein
MIKLFAANNLAFSVDKTHIKKFKTKNSAHPTLHIGYKENYKGETVNTKFLGLQTDNHRKWKNYIEEMIPKVSGARYASSSMVHISNINTL